MPKELLYVAYVRAVFQQMRGEGMAQAVNGRSFVYAGGSERRLADMLRASYRKMGARLGAGEYPCLDAVHGAVILKEKACVVGKRGVALLPSLARNADKPAGDVHVFLFERDRLAYP